MKNRRKISESIITFERTETVRYKFAKNGISSAFRGSGDFGAHLGNRPPGTAAYAAVGDDKKNWVVWMP